MSTYAFVDPLGAETTAEMAIIYKSNILNDLQTISKENIPIIQNILRNMCKAGAIENDAALDRVVHDLAFGRQAFDTWYTDYKNFTDGEKEYAEIYRIKELIKQNTKKYTKAKNRGASMEELLKIDAEAVRLEMALQAIEQKEG